MKKLLRKLRWRNDVKKQFINIISEFPLGYPVILFIELEGEKLYIKYGFEEFKKIIISKYEEVSKNLFKGIEDAIEEQEKVNNMTEEERIEYNDKLWDDFSIAKEKEKEEEIDEAIRKGNLLIEKLK